MLYCRNKAKSFDEFIFLMEKLGYEVKTGAHISVKADAMRRSKRLDTLDEEFSVQSLQKYYEQPRPYKYVELPVYQSGYALVKKPKNAFQQRYYGKLYRMCVVQKYRFQYKYTRYQQDLIRMKELQEEYLFINRTGINGWADVFHAKSTAERKIADIDAKKKELYNEHARYKYQYEKDGDAVVYLYHEAHYREQLAELKEKRKEAKSELGTINRCLSESTYAHLEIPDDVDIENLYDVNVPKLEQEQISYPEYNFYEEKTAESENWIYEAETMPESTPEASSILEPTEVIPEETHEEVQEDTELMAVDVIEEVPFEMTEPEMTKERYEALTDEEKIEWLGITDCDVQERIRRFVSKLDSIGIVYKYSADMLDEFMRIETVAERKEREDKQLEKETGRKYTTR